MSEAPKSGHEQPQNREINISASQFASVSEPRPGKQINEDAKASGIVTLSDGTKIGILAVADGVSQSGYGLVTDEYGMTKTETNKARRASARTIKHIGDALQSLGTPPYAQAQFLQVLKDINKATTNDLLEEEKEIMEKRGSLQRYYQVNGLPASTLVLGLVFPDATWLSAPNGEEANAVFVTVGDSPWTILHADGTFHEEASLPDKREHSQIALGIGTTTVENFDAKVTISKEQRVTFALVNPGDTILAASDFAPISTIVQRMKEQEQRPLNEKIEHAVKDFPQTDDATIAAIRVQ